MFSMWLTVTPNYPKSPPVAIRPLKQIFNVSAPPPRVTKFSRKDTKPSPMPPLPR